MITILQIILGFAGMFALVMLGLATYTDTLYWRFLVMVLGLNIANTLVMAVLLVPSHRSGRNTTEVTADGQYTR